MTTLNEKQTEVVFPSWLIRPAGFLLVTGSVVASPAMLERAAEIVSVTKTCRVITGSLAGVDQAVVNTCTALNRPYTAIGGDLEPSNGAGQYFYLQYRAPHEVLDYMSYMVTNAVFIVAPGDQRFNDIYEHMMRKGKGVALWRV